MTKNKELINKDRQRLFYFLLAGITLLFCFVLLESGLRFYNTIKYGMPFFKPEHIVYNYYYELRAIDKDEISRNNGVYDILIMGGSVLDPDPNYRWTDFNTFLREYLEAKSDARFQIYNTARTAMNSLDSRNKVEFLDPAKQFDAILWYHNINDIRANNVPKNLFKRDYSHILWYDKIRALKQNYPFIRLSIIPYYVRLAWIKVKEKLGVQKYVPDYWSMLADWVPYGADHKTTDAFRENLEVVIARARRDRSLLILPTFAYRDVDIGNMWGQRENVMRSLSIHNEAIRDTARKYQGDPYIHFIDIDQMLTKNDETFHDICHFKDHGAREFAAYIGEEILKTVQGQY